MGEASVFTANIIGVELCEKNIYQKRKMANVLIDSIEALRNDPIYGENSENFKAWEAERARKEATK